VRIRVLGSAAGGGFPQWNCGCLNCRLVRRHDGQAYARTQESVAVGTGAGGWFLINASPEIRSQIESFGELWPKTERHSPIAGILLTNGDLDHCLGLLSLRESHPLVVYATRAVRDGFCAGNVLYRTLERFAGQIDWRLLELGREQPLGDPAGGFTITALPVPGKLPLHLEGLRAPSPEDNVGLIVRGPDPALTLGYLSGVGGPSPEVERIAAEANVLFFDGTFWSSNELIEQKLGTRRAEEMAHWPIGGPEGSLAFLSRIPSGEVNRRIYIHVNNTNPILREGSDEQRAVTAAGLEVAVDGMEL
jgi:pyrroloquinoline quinone biosynthesis protein B